MVVRIVGLTLRVVVVGVMLLRCVEGMRWCWVVVEAVSGREKSSDAGREEVEEGTSAVSRT